MVAVTLAHSCVSNTPCLHLLSSSDLLLQLSSFPLHSVQAAFLLFVPHCFSRPLLCPVLPSSFCRSPLQLLPSNLSDSLIRSVSLSSVSSYPLPLRLWQATHTSSKMQEGERVKETKRGGEWWSKIYKYKKAQRSELSTTLYN